MCSSLSDKIKYSAPVTIYRNTIVNRALLNTHNYQEVAYLKLSINSLEVFVYLEGISQNSMIERDMCLANPEQNNDKK